MSKTVNDDLTLDAGWREESLTSRHARCGCLKASRLQLGRGSTGAFQASGSGSIPLFRSCERPNRDLTSLANYGIVVSYSQSNTPEDDPRSPSEEEAQQLASA